MSTLRVVPAKIRWQSREEGGRSALPADTRYLTVGLFYNPAGKQFEGGWSTIVESEEPLNSSRNLLVSISLLVPEHAPEDILGAGNYFELTEGTKIVAKGEILTAVHGFSKGQLQHTTPTLMAVG